LPIWLDFLAAKAVSNHKNIDSAIAIDRLQVALTMQGSAPPIIHIIAPTAGTAQSPLRRCCKPASALGGLDVLNFQQMGRSRHSRLPPNALVKDAIGVAPGPRQRRTNLIIIPAA
jgi:hypothetical protein